jgi:CubicO group peptidase (beta-lactamase class C family)
MSTPGEPLLDGRATAALDRLLGDWERTRDLSGTVLLSRVGEPQYRRCLGTADRSCATPVHPGTRFALASVTKLFTAAAVADLVAAGSLRFDDAVAGVLPPASRPSTLRPDVTVHHLLTHTSGIADYFEEDPGWAAAEQPDDYGDLWTTVPVATMQRPADFLPLFGDRPPLRPPGLVHQYSNAGYVVLGLVVEQVAGQPYTEVVTDRVLHRAGMAASGFLRSDEAHADVAVGYLPRPDGGPWRTNVHRVPVVGGPDGGAFATADDLVRFLRRLDDGTLLGATRDTVLARHVDLGDGYARGYGVLHHPDGRWRHGGGDPGVEVVVQRWPEEDVDLVVLTNGEGLVDEVDEAVVRAWRGGAGGP